ncbi:hypothetical protein [Parasphingorhabdus sp.]|uniref:hypothetical protein n=1 Tax=Parasphingorhabdus sp. TaxID=2709688 RepID=UPI003A914A56
MSNSIEKRRARWLRNKRAARERDRPTPEAIDPDFEAAVFEERDARASINHRAARLFRQGFSLITDPNAKAIKFAADVWAAETLINAQWGSGSATPTSIKNLLKEWNKTYGYTDESLRKVIYKARKRVKILESRGQYEEDPPYWLPFG